MRRELLIHFTFLILLFSLITLFKRWFDISYWPFWVGGILGTLLPDLDHLIYVYFLGPQEVTSQRVGSMVSRGQIFATLDLLADTRYERTRLVFHTALFQIIFVIASFLIITSSGSIFGRGIVIAFLLHLVVDQFVDLMKTDGLTTWFRQYFPEGLDKSKVTLYWVGNIIVVILFGFIF